MKVRKPKNNKIDLTNDGTLSIFILGSGGAFTKTLSQNNILIVKGNSHVLVDCGTKTPGVLYRFGVPITDISTFLVTHSHADHIGGLEEAMLMARYVARKKPRIIITPEYQKLLWNRSLRGGCEQNELHDGSPLGFEDFFEVLRPNPLNNGSRLTHELQLGELNLKLFRTIHFPEQARSWKESFYSVGLVIDNRVLYTGDTQYDPDLIHELDQRFEFETIFHDVQFFTGGIHASLDEISELEPELRKRMLLMHYSDLWESYTETVSKRGFAGFVQEHRYYDFPSTP